MYTKQTWINGSSGGTPLNATRLNHIEDGVAASAPTPDSTLDGKPVKWNETTKTFEEYVPDTTALDSEITNRTNADSALSGRLDTLEADPTTQTAVNNVITSLNSETSARQSADSSLDSRVSALEAGGGTGGGGIGIGFVSETNGWQPNHTYSQGNTFTANAQRFIVTTAYTSGTTFGSTDLSNIIYLGANQGYPTGGSAGQILIKQSTADYDVLWTTPAQPSNNTPLAVGPVANPGVGSDLARWDHVHVGGAGGGASLINSVWLPNSGIVSTGTEMAYRDFKSQSPASAGIPNRGGSATIWPISFTQATQISFGINITTAGDAGTTFFRVFIWESNSAGTSAGSLVFDSGRVDAGSTGKKWTAGFTPDPTKQYWWSVVGQTSGTPTQMPVASYDDGGGRSNVPIIGPGGVYGWAYRYAAPTDAPSDPWGGYITTDRVDRFWLGIKVV